MAGVPLGFERFRPWYAAIRQGGAAPFDPLALSGLVAAFDRSRLDTMYLTSAGATNITTAADPVGKADSVVGSIYADQATSTARPLYQTSPSRIVFDGSDDAHIIRLGAAKAGTFFTATTQGVVAGTYTAGADYQIPTNPLYEDGENNQTYKLLYDRVLTAGEVEQVIAWLKANHNAGDDVYTGNWINRFRARTDITSFDAGHWDTSGVTSLGATFLGMTNLTEMPLIDTSGVTGGMTNTWQNCTSMTSFPLIDTSGVTSVPNCWDGCVSLTSLPLLNLSLCTNVAAAWSDCQSLESFPAISLPACTVFTSAWRRNYGLTSFPLITVNAAATSFVGAWQFCSSLADFPAGFFDGCSCTNFTVAFSGTALTQTSIDNILVSINSNGTSGGTFNQSGGFAPSATGEAAIDAMRARGWTVTVTGGY